MPQTALLLDADDTVFDTRSAMVLAGRAAVRAVWPQIEPDVAQAAAVRFHADPCGFFLRFTTGELSFEAMRAARVADLVTSLELGQPPDPAGPAELQQRFEHAYGPVFEESIRPFADVAPLLRWCRDRSVPVGVLTNSSGSYTELKLRVAGLSGAFAVVVSRDTLGYGKPDPRVFLHACRMLGSVPARTVYVGDDLDIDARAASAAGLHGVWLNRSERSSRGLGAGDVTVRDLSGVLAIMTASGAPADALARARPMDLGGSEPGR